MKYLTFKNGDKIPMIGLGTYKADEGKVYEGIRSAIKIGYRHFDCAHNYGNEAEIGQALADAMAEGEVTREELWITSKLWNDSHQEHEVEPAIRHTLKNLQLDYLDLYLIHWPMAVKHGHEFPDKAENFYKPGEISLSETWAGMLKVKEKSLAKHVGVSNFNVAQINQIIADTGQVPEMNQIEVHPYLQQNELKEHADSTGYFITAYKPIGSGDLVNENMKKIGIPSMMQNETLVKIAKELNAPVSHVLLAWLRQRGIVAVPKSSNATRQEENYKSMSLELTDEHMDAISTLEKGFRYVDATFFCGGESPYTVEDIWGK